MLFHEELKRRTECADAVVRSYLPNPEGYSKTLLEAMDYSVLAGGKRLRPILMRLSYELYGGAGTIVEPFMAALEMIHTYSLVHDDLPALDNDEYRRGKKTTHAVYGEPMAILAGDGLLNLAFETASQAFDQAEDAAGIGRALQVLARKSGIQGMLGGQAYDVEKDGQPLSAEELYYIHMLKTGALIECALMTGAVLAGAGAEEIARMEKIGGLIGYAFQVQDDILDVEGDEALLGKSVGSDEKNHKTTYVTLYGIENARTKVDELTREAISLLDELPEEHAFLRALLLSLAGRSF